MRVLAVLAITLILMTCSAKQAETPEYVVASAESQPATLTLCMSMPDREHIKDILLEALDASLKAQIQALFLTWLKDERGQPGRARLGVEQAIRAYHTAREGALHWIPMECAG